MRNKNWYWSNFKSSLIGNSNNKSNFPHKLLLTNTQVSKLPKTFENKASANIKLWKTNLPKIVKFGGFSDRLLASLLKTGLSLIKIVPKPLARSVLIPLGLTGVVSATDAVIQTKILCSGTVRLEFLNEDMNDTMKIIKSLEESV